MSDDEQPDPLLDCSKIELIDEIHELRSQVACDTQSYEEHLAIMRERINRLETELADCRDLIWKLEQAQPKEAETARPTAVTLSVPEILAPPHMVSAAFRPDLIFP